jgi:hypothetical protein
MVIDFAKDFGGPLPAPKASQTGAALESYLIVMPGEQLAAIFDKWNARLLEASVRSFLQARAKTNKGIRRRSRTNQICFFRTTTDFQPRPMRSLASRQTRALRSHRLATSRS